MDSHVEQQESQNQRFIKLVQAGEQIDVSKDAYSSFSSKEILIPSIGKVYLFGQRMKKSGEMIELSVPAIALNGKEVIFGKSEQFDTKYYLTDIFMRVPGSLSHQLEAIMRHPELIDQYKTQFDEGPELEHVLKNTDPLEAVPQTVLVGQISELAKNLSYTSLLIRKP